ncbi:MAG: hypothetical protein VX252_07635 [Myxococcota bacterium]|nr:hypothetical protein [Myxococcota bacterium]
MRLEYGFSLDAVKIPRFAVEAQEGIGKLFTLATLVMNVLETHESIEIVFHGLNPEDPKRKIASFRQIMDTCPGSSPISFEEGEAGSIAASSSSYQWLVVQKA